jgi:hypothetical protein
MPLTEQFLCQYFGQSLIVTQPSDYQTYPAQSNKRMFKTMTFF